MQIRLLVDWEYLLYFYRYAILLLDRYQPEDWKHISLTRSWDSEEERTLWKTYSSEKKPTLWLIKSS